MYQRGKRNREKLSPIVVCGGGVSTEMKWDIGGGKCACCVSYVRNSVMINFVSVKLLLIQLFLLLKF